jgi:hypothetical protein
MRWGVALVAISAALFSAEASQAQTTPAGGPAATFDTPGASLTAPGERSTAPDRETGGPPSALPGGGDAFTFIPVVTAATYFDDNVFSSNANRLSDWAFLLRPELSFVARGANHTVEGNAYVEGRKYSRFSSEDQLNGGASLGGTLMLDPDTQLVGKAAYVHAHEDRGVSESQLTGLAPFDKPVAYNQFQAATALNKRFDRWWTSIGAAGQWIDYQDPTVLGVPVSQSYRDGMISALTTRLGYVVAPLTSLFVQWSGNHRNFNVDIFDSWGYQLIAGVLLEPGPGARVKGEAYAGYMRQRYTGPSLLPVSTFTYGGLLAWMITPAATLTVGGHRDALESGLVVGGVMGVSLVESVAGARIDYRLAPQWTVGAGVSYVADEFQGAGRTDRYVSPLASIKYFATPNVTLGLDYRNLNFDSSGTGVPTYYRNVYMASISAKW